jgi:hypothetical protein
MQTIYTWWALLSLVWPVAKVMGEIICAMGVSLLAREASEQLKEGFDYGW